MSVAEQVFLAQILDPDQPFVGIMKINFRCANTVSVEELRDSYVMTVLFSLEVVLNQDQLLFGCVVDPVKFPARAALFDRSDLHRVDVDPRKMDPSLAKKGLGFHFRRRGRGEIRRLFDGSGQYSVRAHYGKRFLHPATGCCSRSSPRIPPGSFQQQPCILTVPPRLRSGRSDAPAEATAGQ